MTAAPLVVGTWNAAGTWGPAQADFVTGLGCDVLLLTELPVGATLPDWVVCATTEPMLPGRHWAAVCTPVGTDAPLRRPDPHAASVVVEWQGWLLCASVLPWRTASGPPWVGDSQGARTEEAVQRLHPVLAGGRRVVWGGDLNLSFCGPQWAGSTVGHAAVLAMTGPLGLEVATADLPHPLPDAWSIDHIAVPSGFARESRCVPAVVDGRRLSDHDAYVVVVDARDGCVPT